MRSSAGYRLAGATGVLFLLALAGCTPRTTAPTHNPTPIASPTATAAATPPRTPTPVPTPTPTPGPAPTAAAVPVAEWTHQFGSPALDRGNALAVDGEGNIIVVGATQGALPGQTLGGYWDGYARKLSPTGAEMWTLQFTNSVSVGALAVAVDGAGNIIVAGHVQGELPGQTGAGLDDAYVRRLSPDGVELWTHQFGSADSDWAFGVALDRSGNIIVAGAANGALPGQTSAGGEDAFVQKLSPEGNELWTSQFGSAASDRVWSVSLDGSENIVVAGRTQSALPGQTSAGSWDAFVRKYSPDGTELWTRQFGTPLSDEAFAIAVDGTGNAFVAGDTEGNFPGQTQTNAGYDDASVHKLSPAGADLGTREFGSPAPDVAFGVAVDGTGNIFAAGATSGAMPGQTSVGNWDAFVVRLNQPVAP